jgi:hypothetical protein
MSVLHEQRHSLPQPFRLDVQLHDQLTNNSDSPSGGPSPPKNGHRHQTFPEPVFPQHPIEKHKFDIPQSSEMKKSCHTHRFSTLNHDLGFCYNDCGVIKWVRKQAAHGFQGVTGSFA